MAEKRMKTTENLNDLSIQQLEALLRQDFADANGTPDEELMMEVTAAILRKEQEQGCAVQPDVEQAWSDLQQFYLEEEAAAAFHEGQPEVQPRSDRRPQHRIRRRAITLFRYVAAAVLVASLLFLTAFATIAEVRDGTLKFLVEVTGSFTRYQLVPKEEGGRDDLPERLPGSDAETLLGYQFPKMPEGFALVSEQKSTSQAMARYVREDGAEIHVSVRYFLSGPTSAYTGDADVQSVIVQGYEGQLLRRSYLLADGSTEPWSQLLWGNTEAGVMVSLTGYRVEGTMLLELAEQAQWVGWVENSAQPVLMGCRLPQPPEGFWLESYGENELAHYAQYRADTTNVRTVIYFRVSDEPFRYKEYAQTGAKYGRVSLGSDYAVKVDYTVYRTVDSGPPLKFPAIRLIWEDDSAGDGKTRYFWLEGCNVPEETLRSLAKEIQMPQ